MRNPNPAPQIFISYARENKARAEELYQALVEAGFRPWMDVIDLLPGQKWAVVIPQAIRDSDFFLALFSKDSIEKRGFLQKEFRQALEICQEMLEEDIYFIPVRLDDCKVPDRFRDFQWVDLFTNDDLVKLINAIRIGFETRFGTPANPVKNAIGGAEMQNQISKNANKVLKGNNIKILFLAANPIDTPPLMLDEEIRAIDHALRLADFRENFTIQQQWALQVSDLQESLLRHKPDIVHFSGHGNSANEIILKNSDGQSQSISARALSRLFSVLKENIRCVVLNACYSVGQAEAIAEHIDCVVGMSKAVGDEAAISFATAFYRALGYGKDIQTAFDSGCIEIDLEGLDDQDTPKLFCSGHNSRDIVFIQTASQ